MSKSSSSSRKRSTTKMMMAAAAAPLCTTAAAVLVLLSDLATASVASQQQSGLVSFPLVPHHVQRRRLGLDAVSTPDEYESRIELLRGTNHRHNNRNNRHNNRHLDSNNDPHEIMAGLYMGYGTHYVDLYCGTPPQRQTVIVDTGSSQTAFPCRECSDCGSNKFHTGPLFDEDQSQTFQSFDCDHCSQRSTCNEDTDRCDIEQYYSEGSFWKAYEAMDTCYMGGYHNQAILQDNGNLDDVDPAHAAAFAFDTRIGCQTEITGLFKTQLADGIMGMSDSKQAFWHQMYRSHKIRQKQFSLCYTRPNHALREGTEAGAITLGGSDERLHNISPMVYTTLVGTSSELEEDEGKSGYYDIHVREMYWREGKAGESALSMDNSAKIIKLAGASMINDEGGVIVDSGTTDTYFSKVIKKQLSANWEKLAGMQWNHNKQTLTPEEAAKLPTLLIQFAGDEEMNKVVADQHGNGDPNQIAGLAGDLDKNYPYDVVVAIPASHYMEGDATVTNRLYATETDGSVLGANALIGHDVNFDAQNMRIGWAESSCDYFGLVKSSGYTSPMEEVYESKEEVKAEDEKEEVHEDEKEEYDQENTNQEIEQDNENIQDFEKDGGKVEHFTKKGSKNIEIPIDDLIDNPAIAGIGFAVFFLGGIFCVFKCCVPAVKKRRRKKRYGGKQEIEFGTTTTRRRSYRDHFDDEDDDSDSDFSDYNNGRYDDSDEYGMKGL